MEQYAKNYVVWYFARAGLAFNAGQQSAVSQWLQTAFRSPEPLSEYTGAKVSDAAVSQLRATVARMVKPNDGIMTALVQDALANNPKFNKRCMEQCRQEALKDIDAERVRRKSLLEEEGQRHQQELDKEYERKRQLLQTSLTEQQRKLQNRLKELQRQVEQQQQTLAKLDASVTDRMNDNDRLRNIVKPLQEKVNDLRRQATSAQSEISRLAQQKNSEIAALRRLQQHKDDELATIKQDRETLLSQIDEDVSLKLGLRAVVRTLTAERQRPDGSEAAEPGIRPAAYRTYPVERSDTGFRSALAEDLHRLGVASTKDYESVPLNFAEACSRTLSATGLLAVDSAFAAPLANALSYATHGLPARHVSIPANWNDAAVLERLLDDDDNDILVLDNVMDTVNEGLLFALSRLSHELTFVLPVGAYGNLRLLASEVWNHVFYLPTEQYIMMPTEPTTLCRSASGRKPIVVTQQSIVGKLTNSIRPLVPGDMPLSSLTLPASVEARFGDPEIGQQWVSAHIALHIYAMFGTEAAQTFAARQPHAGFATALLRRIDRSRNAR
ncbi:hypothetical protein [Bifidobacterium leontopitheci]|nr:hypothetical protein [Bifidobacterium leontopitheci]